ncbi:MAG: hypothetical protein KBD21_01040 [Candidatus Pacebacteria bacterium]|nr:hypothetical protein [Candidatus Paceibacterota bacterium]
MSRRYWLYGVSIILAFCVLGLFWFLYRTGKEVNDIEHSDVLTSAGFASSPLNASYNIEDTEVELTEGRADVREGVEVKVLHEPILADLNADSVDDAILFLEVLTVGELAPRTYLAVAVSGDVGFFGSNTILLGSESYHADVLHDAIIVSSDTASTSSEQSGESATTTLPAYVHRYFSVLGATLFEFGPFAADVTPFVGRYSAVDNERFFTSCEGEMFRLGEDSRALAAIDAIYRERMIPGRAGSVFMVLAASVSGSAEGALNDEQNITVHAVLSAPLTGACADVPIDTLLPTEMDDGVATSSETQMNEE